jgi:hypothetical protein
MPHQARDLLLVHVPVAEARTELMPEAMKVESV